MAELSRLRWLCRRGMKELDLVMTRYLELRYAQASSREQQDFESLLAMQDPDLYALLMGRQPGSDQRVQDLIQSIRSLSSSK